MNKTIITILLTVFMGFCLLGLDAKAQSLSEQEFRKDIYEVFNNNYNITYLPEEFYQCAFTVYKMEGDTGEGFYTGYEVIKQCLTAQAETITFSDEGQKFFEYILPAFINVCRVSNQSYSQIVNVSGYCSCLYTQLEESGMPIQAMINPDLVDGDDFNRIGYYCIDKHQH